MYPSLTRKVGTALALALALLISATLITRRVALQARQSEARVVHTHLTRQELRGMVSVVQDLESASRGYALTGDDSFLAPYDRAGAQLAGRLGLLRGLIDNPAQHQRMAVLSDLVRRRFDVAATLIRIRRERGAEQAAAFVRRREGKEVMDELRRVVAAIDAEEQLQLAQRQATAEASTRRFIIVVAVGNLLAFGLLGIAAWQIVLDVRARERAEAALAQSEQRFRHLLDAAPDGMVIVDQHGTIQLVNQQTELLFRYARAELIGKPVEILMPAHVRRHHAELRTAYAEGATARGMGTGLRLQGRRADGSEFPVEVSLSPMQTAEGQLITAAIRDITPRVAAEEQLHEQAEELTRSNAELQQFAYVASHDLQEPLRMVASYTQLLARRYAGRLDADADEFINYAVDGANRMQRLINDLLAYSRVGTRGRELSETSAEAAVARAISNLQVAIVESGATIYHGPLPRVWADESQLTQLFQNLIANAIKFRGATPPQILISADGCTDGDCQFQVRDNGIGIEAQYFERIFGMFQRLHGPGEYAGSGIGLAICKRIVERHRGRIWLESVPGQGTTFFFTMPGA